MQAAVLGVMVEELAEIRVTAEPAEVVQVLRSDTMVELVITVETAERVK
jgi:hypothetical protein